MIDLRRKAQLRRYEDGSTPPDFQRVGPNQGPRAEVLERQGIRSDVCLVLFRVSDIDKRDPITLSHVILVNCY